MGIRDEINRQKAEDQDLANRRKAYEESQKPKAAAPATTTTTAPATTTTSTGSTPLTPATSTNGAAPPPATPDANSSSLDWAKYYYNQLPSLPSSQSIDDFRTIYGYDTPYREVIKRATGQPVDFVALKEQADAARQRLGPTGAAAADIAGNVVNPVGLLNAIPKYGPGLAGLVQGGLQSYGHGDPGIDVFNKSLLGLGAGLASQGLTTPSVLRGVGSELAERGPGALVGWYFGMPHGLESLGASGGALLSKGEAIGRPFQFAGDYVKDLGTSATGKIANWSGWPAARAALQPLLFGLGQTAVQGNATNFLPGP